MAGHGAPSGADARVPLGVPEVTSADERRRGTTGNRGRAHQSPQLTDTPRTQPTKLMLQAGEKPTPVSRVRRLTISASPESLEIQTAVPERWTGHMLQTLKCLGTTAASTAGPVLVLKMASVIAMPWEATLGMAVLTALMPLVSCRPPRRPRLPRRGRQRYPALDRVRGRLWAVQGQPTTTDNDRGRQPEPRSGPVRLRPGRPGTPLSSPARRRSSRSPRGRRSRWRSGRRPAGAGRPRRSG